MAEIIEDNDFSSDECKAYRPTRQESTELEVDEEVYLFLEHIDLEWPAMTLDTCESKVLVGTFPDVEKEKSASQLIELELKHNLKKLQYLKHTIPRVFNKLRVSNGIFGLSDKFITKLDKKFKIVAEVEGSYSFGLCVTRDWVIVGCRNGSVEVYDLNLKLVRKMSSGDVPIECVGFSGNGQIITGSLDHKIRIFDLKGSLLSTIETDSEINCLEARNEKFVFGDDNGQVHLMDLSTGSKEVYKWHCTPISFVRWKDDNVFLTGSDEQVCLWDITLEDEEALEVPKNLLFVHQGQRNYKDCAFYGNKIIVTSEDGLCVFEPISLVEEPLEE